MSGSAEKKNPKPPNKKPAFEKIVPRKKTRTPQRNQLASPAGRKGLEIRIAAAKSLRRNPGSGKVAHR